MSVLGWNCRGAGKAAMVQELRDLVRKFAPTLLCIVETQLDRVRVESLAGTLGFDNAFVVSSQGRSGGLGIFWNNPIKIEILGYSVYHIDCSIADPGPAPWMASCFYGEARTNLRNQTWDIMKGIANVSNLPWVCIGDFNEVLHPEEQEGIGERSNTQIQGFRDAADIFMLMDLGYIGNFWTFEKKVTGALQKNTLS